MQLGMARLEGLALSVSSSPMGWSSVTLGQACEAACFIIRTSLRIHMVAVHA